MQKTTVMILLGAAVAILCLAAAIIISDVVITRRFNESDVATISALVAPTLAAIIAAVTSNSVNGKLDRHIEKSYQDYINLRRNAHELSRQADHGNSQLPIEDGKDSNDERG